ncbi:MAG TPA: SsrA-binding protein SmpB [Kiritimatiellia bacterium]|nr:SsrA-binding protein SmpB [Kiritimatiellia bacterium]
MTAPGGATSSDLTILSTNRKASHEYHFVERFEAGIVLTGAEVKSIRNGKFSLNEAFARMDGDELWLYGMHVQPYPHTRLEDQIPTRPRKLLMHRRELIKLTGQMAQKGYALVPTKVVLKRGMIKVDLALGKGKLHEDKREDLKKRTADRETARTVARFVKR